MIISETGNVWEHCPRGFLRRQTRRLEEQGLTLRAVFENEFFLLHKNAAGILAP
jgi:glutamine synthetase